MLCIEDDVDVIAVLECGVLGEECCGQFFHDVAEEAVVVEVQCAVKVVSMLGEDIAADADDGF